MKNVQFIFAFILLSFMLITCNQSKDITKGEITIVDVRNGKDPDKDLTAHKPYDVVAYRTNSIVGDGYQVRYYQKENDSLNSHQAIMAATDDYDKLAYIWLNDTSISIRLFSTVTKKEKALKLSGYGGRSSIVSP